MEVDPCEMINFNPIHPGEITFAEINLSQPEIQINIDDEAEEKKLSPNKSFTKKSKTDNFDVERIMTRIKDKSGRELIYEVSSILKESKRDILENILAKIEKPHFLSILEKTLNIQNSGGEYYTRFPKTGKYKKKKEEPQNSQKVLKTAGGVFFSLAKKEGNFTKEEIKEIFQSQQNVRLNKENKKLLKYLRRLKI